MVMVRLKVHRPWRLIAGALVAVIFPLTAVVAQPVTSGTAAAATTHALTSNPTCVTEPGFDTITVGGCVQAWSNGFTLSWTGYGYESTPESYGWSATNGSSSSGPNQLSISCEGPNFSIFVPVASGEYFIDQFVVSSAGSPTYAHADLVVGASNSSPAPPTLCNPPIQGSTVGCRGTDVAIAVTPSIYGSPPDEGGWIATSQGQICTFGNAGFFGDASSLHPNDGIVGIAETPDGRGYWMLGGDGGVFSFGDAHFYGSTGNIVLNRPAIGMAATPDGKGYWFVASDGGIFAYGDAYFYGSMGGQHLNKPVVGMAADFASGGYWEVASDGGVFAFNAAFHGSTGNLTLAQPIVGMEAAPDGSGYRFVASDGGVFCFNQPFAGSLAGQSFNSPSIVAMAPFGASGYWLLLSNDGQIVGFGGALTRTAV
jgi:hypothetical protein